MLFDLIFSIFMILFPALTARFLRTKNTTDPERVRLLERRLWKATAVLSAYTLLVIGLKAGVDWKALPKAPTVVVWMITLPASIGQLGFFVLWFAFANPLVKAYRPESFDPQIVQDLAQNPGPVRSASLTARDPLPVFGRFAWIWPVGMWLIGFSTFAYGWNLHGVPEGVSATKHLAIPVLSMLMSFSVALMIPLGRRTMFMTPEPLDPNHSPELVEAYGKLRVAKARATFTLILIVVAASVALPIVLVFQIAELGACMGMVGAAGGTVIGVAGGVFGTLMSVHALKIQRIRHQLSQSQTQTP